MVKEIERAGIPVVHICTVTPISMTVGANRIVPAVAIPHPLGNPALETAEEKKSAHKATFLSTVRKEFIRILATSVMIAVCVCNLAGTISTDSTVVFLGFSVALFCFGTMVKG